MIPRCTSPCSSPARQSLPEPGPDTDATPREAPPVKRSSVMVVGDEWASGIARVRQRAVPRRRRIRRAEQRHERGDDLPRVLGRVALRDQRPRRESRSATREPAPAVANLDKSRRPERLQATGRSPLRGSTSSSPRPSSSAAAWRSAYLTPWLPRHLFWSLTSSSAAPTVQTQPKGGVV